MKNINGSNLNHLWDRIIAFVEDRLSSASVVDLTSAQNVSGVKNFTNGIKIGGDNGVQLTYDEGEGAMKFIFLAPVQASEDDSDNATEEEA